MMRRTLFAQRLLPVLVATTLLTSGCGGGDTSVVRPPESSSTTSATPSSSSATPSSPATVVVNPRTVVTPHAGLKDGQTVTVKASGFSPGKSLVVVQCVDKGQQTGPGDCNLADASYVQTDASGSATTQLQVTKGPFGGNGVECSAELSCLISVTEASPTPSEEADTPISFG